jgi:hypothetical protein
MYTPPGKRLIVSGSPLLFAVLIALISSATATPLFVLGLVVSVISAASAECISRSAAITAASASQR